MANQYVVIAASLIGDCAFGTQLLGVTESMGEAFRILEHYDYKKRVADEFRDCTPDALTYDYESKDFGIAEETGKAYYEETHTVSDSEYSPINDMAAHGTVILTIFET